MDSGPQKRVDALNVSGAPMSSLGMALKYAGNVKTRTANPVLPHRRKPEGLFMLVIKQSQIAQLSELACLRFAATLVDHLAAFSPPLFEAVGAEQMRRVVDFGMARAAAHGFSRQGPVRLYLELMLLFGYSMPGIEFKRANRGPAGLQRHVPARTS